MKRVIRNYKCLITIFSGCLLLALSACSSTTLSTRWNDPNFSNVPLKKIMVIAVVDKDVNRRSLEDSYVERLKEHGIDGVTSYPLIADPEKAIEEKQLKDVILQSGVDAVLISTLIEIDEKETYTPSRVDWVPAGGYGYYGHYNASINNVYRRGVGHRPVRKSRFFRGAGRVSDRCDDGKPPHGCGYGEALHCTHV